jgi:hypothetical protein
MVFDGVDEEGGDGKVAVSLLSFQGVRKDPLFYIPRACMPWSFKKHTMVFIRNGLPPRKDEHRKEMTQEGDDTGRR